MIVLTIMATTVIMSSCENEEPNADLNLVEPDVKEHFKTLGFDVSDMRAEQMENPLTGEINKQYILEGDIAIAEQQMLEMLESKIHHEGPNGEQYRTNNLVSQGRTINVIGYTANNANGLDNKMRTALQYAVDNFNALNINLNFTLTFGSNFNAYDMVVYRVSGGGGGSAGFPSGGAPNKFIQINSGTSAYDVNVVEHVITHEMGHSVGMRHTDWFNRAYSCGTGGSEGTAGVGAILVPGTPDNEDANSIMLSCFSTGEDGEFGFYDRVALEYLY